MPEHPTDERSKLHSDHYHRRTARDRGDSRSRSPGRSRYRSERDQDEYHRRRDQKHSRSPSPRYSRRNRCDRKKDWVDRRAHEGSLVPSRSRGRSVTPRGRRSDSPSESAVSASVDSRDPVKRDHHNPKSRSHSYERNHNRHRSRSHSRDRERRKSKYKDKDHDRKKRHKDKERKKEKEEKRSILTGKKIKLKVHRDPRDLEMDANREDLLQFLNSTCE